MRNKKDLFSSETIRRLEGFIALRVREREEAKEILQETLSAAYQSLPNFVGRSSFFSWLCGIAKHEISDFYRKKKIKTILFSHWPFLENLVDRALGPEEVVIEKELKGKVRKVLRKMTEGYQIILRLKYIEGRSVAEIARRLGLSFKAVESRLTRARLAFREIWVTENERLQRKISAKGGSTFGRKKTFYF